jgi:hypothetical protein
LLIEQMPAADAQSVFGGGFFCLAMEQRHSLDRNSTAARRARVFRQKHFRVRGTLSKLITRSACRISGHSLVLSADDSVDEKRLSANVAIRLTGSIAPAASGCGPSPSRENADECEPQG